MANDIGRQFRGDDRYLAHAVLVESARFGHQLGAAPAFADMALLAHIQAHGRGARDDPAAHFHRVMATRVPTPTVECNSHSLTKRRAPVSPSPNPEPEVQPSVIACSMSGIPGPWSSKTNRTPRF